MGGIRARKQSLILVVKTHLAARKLDQAQADQFELMYRRCRTEREQDEVTLALHGVMDGWKYRGDGGMAGGVYAHLRRVAAGNDVYADEEDEDPPALAEALARARVDVRKRV